MLFLPISIEDSSESSSDPPQFLSSLLVSMWTLSDYPMAQLAHDKLLASVLLPTGGDFFAVLVQSLYVHNSERPGTTLKDGTDD